MNHTGGDYGMITRGREYLQADGTPSLRMLRSVIDEHRGGIKRLERLHNYYTGRHSIEDRIRADGLPNVKMVHDLPRYIVTMASGYLIGKPVSYGTSENEAALQTIVDAFDAANVESVDAELASNASEFGRAVEVLYANEDAEPRCAQIDPRNAFVVYDDTAEHLPMFGVQIGELRDETGGVIGITVTLMCADANYVYEGASESALEIKEYQEHFFDGIPMIEYWNSADERGDYEGIIGLIDAYELLQSDRLNDKIQFVDAILFLTGGVAGIEPTDPDDRRPLPQRIKEDRMILLPEGSDAKWLYKQLSEADVEVLRNAIISDIHKLSMVPDLTDENFASNSSGVAMRYKLLGLEQLTKIKERWFKEGLRSRLRLFTNFYQVKGERLIDPDEITITFTRSLPVNELEVAQMVQTLDGIVPTEILLGQVPFVSDVKAALDMIAKEKAEAEAERARMFETSYQINPPDEGEDETERDAGNTPASGRAKAGKGGKHGRDGKGGAA